MIVFRLSKSAYAKDLSGRGAEISGGRWNSKGTALVYTGQSRALCTTEIAVHTPLGIIPADYEIISIEIPDSIPIEELAETDLPADWRSFPHAAGPQEIGDRFVHAGKSAVLKVPSVVVQGEFNYLINPRHEDAIQVRIKEREPFNFDERLFIK